MKQLLSVMLIFLISTNITAQTFDWSGFPSGGTSYTTGIMTATITSNLPNFQYSSPKYYAGSTVGGGSCGISGGLALEQFFGNITNSHVTLTLDFTGGNTNGTCSVISFQIKDINAEETYQTFRDIVQVSAIDANNTAIPVARIVSTGGTNKTITTSGNTRIIAGSSGSYGSRSTTSCDNVTITVTPPVGIPLRKIIIRYQPEYTACASCYYSYTSPTRPAYQYISIGSIIASASGGGCVVLPIELTSFTSICKNGETAIEWTTSTEINNDFFTIEQSVDGINFTEAIKVQGAGNSNTTNYYSVALKSSKENAYFRLKQTDYDGQFTFSEPIYAKCDEAINSANIYPNPVTNELFLAYDLKNEVIGYIVNVLGERVKNFNNTSDNQVIKISVADLPNGLYNIVLVSATTGEFLTTAKFIKR